MVDIIDLPRVFVRAPVIDWAIDWRGQSAGGDLAGGDQIVINAFPRWTGTLPLVVPRVMLGHLRAIVLRVQGRRNVLRVPMVDPVSYQAGGAPWAEQFRSYLGGTYVEPRPKVQAVEASVAGGATVTVDERPLRRQIPVGAILSYNDWPFAVVGKTGPEAARVLAVERLAVAIPSGAQIDLAATGLFRLPESTSGQPVYGIVGAASVDLPLTEWITR